MKSSITASSRLSLMVSFSQVCIVKFCAIHVDVESLGLIYLYIAKLHHSAYFFLFVDAVFSVENLADKLESVGLRKAGIRDQFPVVCVSGVVVVFNCYPNACRLFL